MTFQTSRQCKRCGNTLPLSQFGIDRSQPDGINRACRDCKRKRDTCTGNGYTKTERDPSLVPPRVINYEGRYTPTSDGTYYRNDGHKHLKSRGFPC